MKTIDIIALVLLIALIIFGQIFLYSCLAINKKKDDDTEELGKSDDSDDDDVEEI